MLYFITLCVLSDIWKKMFASRHSNMEGGSTLGNRITIVHARNIRNKARRCAHHGERQSIKPGVRCVAFASAEVVRRKACL